MPKKALYKRKGFFIFLCLFAVSFGGYYNVKATGNYYTLNVFNRNKTRRKPSYKKGMFKNDKVEIVFIDAVERTNYIDKPIAYTFFSITNLSKEPHSANALFNEYVEVYQELGDVTRGLGYTHDLDESFKEEIDTMEQNIKPGDTVKVAHMGLLNDPNKPVTIMFKENYVSKEPIGRMEIELYNN